MGQACTRCDHRAVTHLAYSGQHLCEQHFREAVERRVRSRIREDKLLPQTATPANPQQWLVGLSGGKDSVVLLTILAETFAQDPRVELTALTIHEGIEGYRDESMTAARALLDRLPGGIEHVHRSYEDTFDVEMDTVVAEADGGMSNCAYCGVFRRDILDAVAQKVEADKLLTGHNLDDEAETALMNVLEGNVPQMAKHYRASLAPFDDRPADPSFVPRAKPLRELPEQEVALYAHLRDLPAHIAECPHAETSFRAELQSILHDLEDAHPGTRHSIMAGYEQLARLAAQDHTPEATPLKPCVECDRPTPQEVCRTCELLSHVDGQPRSG